MNIIKRLFLFFMINILVVFTISSILKILNIHPYLTHYGLDFNSLMIFCLIWGMAGAFISLLLSKTIVKFIFKIKIINNDNNYSYIVSIVKKLSESAGLNSIPDIGIYNSEEVNAFATGPTKNNSLIALSSGLLSRLNDEEIEAVIGHELSHITNGDMVTMTLMQGVVNAFVMFLARILAYAVSGLGKQKNRGVSYGSYYIFTMLFEIIFMVLGSILLASFSRKREYRADEGSAKIAGKDKMIKALQALKKHNNIESSHKENMSVNTLKISSKKNHIIALFATHPSLDDRIDRLHKMV